MNLKKFSNEKEGSRWTADQIASLIQKKHNSIIGLASGKTPITLYEEFARLHEAGALDFSKVVAFVLDEFLGLPPDHPQTFKTFLNQHLLSRVNIPPTNVHIPTVQTAVYERLIQMSGGIDIQILGLGRNGHIGFNEPGTSFDSITHIQELTEDTRQSHVESFGSLDAVPRQAVTMGIGTILKSKQIYLLAFGEGKAKMVKTLLEGKPIPSVPCTALQKHANVTVVVDAAAAKEISSNFRI